MNFAPEHRFGTFDPKMASLCDELERRGFNRGALGGYQSSVFDREKTSVGRAIFNILLGLSVFLIVLFALVFAFNNVDWRKSPSEAQITMASQIKALQNDVVSLSQSNLALTMEINGLTQEKGVLAQIVAKLKEQREINTTHNAALRQVMAATGAIGVQLPSSSSFSDVDTTASVGAQRVQVTPVSVAVADAPQKVIVTPEKNESATN